MATLAIKIFADGADLDGIVELAGDPQISGFTTNPTLMRQSGVKDYEIFARNVLEKVPDRPISFEVFSDDLSDMARQARKIASWGDNVYVKVPVTNTLGESCDQIIHGLSGEGLQLNITAVFTPSQTQRVATALHHDVSAIVSVFAGRIADTGRDPIPLMAESLRILSPYPNIELLWASPREVLNVRQADELGCHIITVTSDLLQKLRFFDYDLDSFSLDTVKMFYNDAKTAGLIL